MKRLYIAIFIIFIFVSCDLPEYYNYQISNNSSENVSYTFNGISDILEPSESKDYQLKKGEIFTGMENINAGSPYGFGYKVKLGMKTTNTGSDYFFYDFNPFDLNVINSLPVTVSIKADNYIDNLNSTTLDIDANSEKTAKIYTNKPTFTSTNNYPIIFDWVFSNNTIYVIIR